MPDAEADGEVPTGSDGVCKSPAEVPKPSIWFAAARRCVLFDGLNAAESKYVFNTARLIPTAAGSCLFEEDDFPSMMYLVASGSYCARVHSAKATDFHVSRDEDGASAAVTAVRFFGPLDNFGCCELLTTMGGRSCSVAVLESGFVWGVPQRVVASKLKIPPPRADLASLVALLQESAALFGGVARDRLVQVCRCASVVEFAEGVSIFEEGGSAEHLYVVAKGRVILSQCGGSGCLEELSRADSFGEAALFAEDERRVQVATASVGKGGSQLVQLQRSSVETVLGFAFQDASESLLQRHQRFVAARDAARAKADRAEAALLDVSGTARDDAASSGGGSPSAPLTEAKRRFHKAAARAQRLELEAFDAAEGELLGVTREEFVRQHRFSQREAQLQRARAVAYAVNDLMREREQSRFEAFVQSENRRYCDRIRSERAGPGAGPGAGVGPGVGPGAGRSPDWASLALKAPSPLVMPDAKPPPFELYARAMDAAQLEYERSTGSRGSGLREVSERERLRNLLPSEPAHGREDGAALSRGTPQRLLLRLLKLVDREEPHAGQGKGSPSSGQASQRATLH